MTKKDTTIRKILAGLTILILGALAVYYVISFSLANNAGKKEETSQRSSPEKKTPKAPAGLIDKPPVANAAAKEQGQRIWPGEYTFDLVFLGLLVCAIYYNVQVIRGKIKSGAIEAFFNKKWAMFILCLFALGWLCDTLPKRYVSQSKYVRIVIGSVAVGLGSAAAIVWVVRKALELKGKYIDH